MTKVGRNMVQAAVINCLMLFFLAFASPGCTRGGINGANQDFSGKNQPALSDVKASEKHISPETSVLEFRILLEANEKLLPEAPCQIRFDSENPGILRFEQNIVRKLSKKIDIPMKASFGKTRIFIKGNFYYCTTGDIEQCRRKNMDLRFPVNVTEDGGSELIVTMRVSGDPEIDDPTKDRNTTLR